MATSNAPTPLLVTHAAARSGFWAFFVPLFLLPLVIGGMIWWDMRPLGDQRDANGELLTYDMNGALLTYDVAWWQYAVVAGLLLLVPLMMSFYSRLSTRYTITARTVMQENGVLSRTSSEVRIADIRNIVVRQTLQERMLNVGTVSFSSAAGDADEIVFRNITNPAGVKATVQKIQDDMGLSALRNSGAVATQQPLTKPAHEPTAAPARDEKVVAELERLLAEQEELSRR